MAVIRKLAAALGLVAAVIGTDKLVRAAKDGYTLALISNNHAINPNLYKSIPLDSIKDIAPISVVGSTPVALVSHPRAWPR